MKYILISLIFLTSLQAEDFDFNKWKSEFQYTDTFKFFFSPDKCNQIIKKDKKVICYDYKARGPKTVYFQIDSEKVNKENILQNPKIKLSKSVPKKYRTNVIDYEGALGSLDCNKHRTNNCNVRYKKHLMIPDKIFDYDLKELQTVYTMENITPIIPNVSNKLISKLTNYQIFLAKRFKKVDIINGLEFRKENYLIKKPVRMLNKKLKMQERVDYQRKVNEQMKKKILIPSGYWSLISVTQKDKKTGKEKRSEVCFYFNNKEIENYSKHKLINNRIDCRILKEKIVKE
jgi:DNA/RNA endonuclease G (NUC1)